MKIGRFSALAYRTHLPYDAGDPVFSLKAWRTHHTGWRGFRLSAIARTEGVEIVLLLAPREDQSNVEEAHAGGGAQAL
jgi:hypothetical protein